jgi:transposase-like protein
VIGFVERGGLAMLKMMPNVKQETIRPLFEEHVAPNSLINTDEYVIYAKLTAWGYLHKTVDHGRGEYARDEDGDGFHEVHCNTQEGIWSLLRSWLRPHRGVSQEKLPFYIGYFEWLHNLRKRGKKALHETFALLLGPDLRTYDQCILSV